MIKITKTLINSKNLKSDINDIVAFLKPFDTTTTKLGAEHEPTLYKVIPHYHNLMDKCIENINDSEIIKYLKFRAAVLIDEKIKLSDLHFYATILSPKYKKLLFLNNYTRQKYYRKLEEYMMNFEIKSIENKIPQNNNNGEISTENDDLLKYQNLSEEKEENVKELERYLDHTVIMKDEEKYWIKYHHDFPVLYAVFLHLFKFPATEFSNERGFNIMSYIHNIRAANTSPKLLMQKSFIYFNNKYY
jgi:hypothetical protein